MRPMEPTDILGNIKLYNADCMEVMKTFKDKQFDLAIVDPPYFDGPNKLGYYGMDISKTKVKRQSYNIIASWDVPKQEYYDEVLRVSKEQIIWGINYFNFLNVPTGRLVWDKKKNDSCTFSDGEIASCSAIETVRFFRYTWDGFIQENMKNKQKKIHPTEKPVQLYKWLLQNYAKEGDTILDTHFGSLSIGIACHDMKFDLTAIELDKDYYEQAKQRLIYHQRQLTLF